MSATIPAATLQKFSAFGDFLRFLRRHAGLTQTELSLAVGYSPAQISRLEQNLRMPDLTTLEARFMDALDLQDDPKAMARLLELARGSRPSNAAREAPPNNLPKQLTSFIGREQEITDVKKLLESHRLVTLTGSGGTGKTRLALQIAPDLLNDYPDGVWLEELAPLHDGALIAQTVLHIFRLRTEPGRQPVEILTEYLSEKSLLIVLDNCEHLLAECGAFVEAVLQAAASVKVLATSREILNLAGEQAYRVPSLKVPNADRLPDWRQLGQFEAVQLFLDRVALVLPGFAVAQSNATALAQICRRLDGIPLAIELAAARVKSMPLETLVSRLDDRFHLLTGGSRNSVPRHQTLRATIDWSYALLSEPEKLLLERLSVFRGGWTLEAAEPVCSGEGIEACQVLDLLSKLMDKSLLYLDEAGRYQMLETVRQYADEKLIEAGQAEWARDRHMQFMVELAELAEPEVRSHNQLLWLNRLEAELDNWRAARAWAQDRDAELSLRLAAALWRFWGIRVDSYEILGWLQDGLAKTEDRLTATRARAFARLSWITLQGYGLYVNELSGPMARTAYQMSAELLDKPSMAIALGSLSAQELYRNPGEAVSFAKKALQLSRELGDHWLAGRAIGLLGLQAMSRNDLTACVTLFEEAIVEERLSGDHRPVAYDLAHLAWANRAQGHVLQAERMLREVHSLAQSIGDTSYFLGVCIELGLIAMLIEDYARAEQLLEEALDVAQDTNQRIWIAQALKSLGLLQWARGDGTAVCEREEAARLVAEHAHDSMLALEARARLPEGYRLKDENQLARLHFTEALVDSRNAGFRMDYCYCLQGLGAVALACGQAERAVQLFAARAKLRETTFAEDYYPFMVRERAQQISQARAQLGEEAFHKAWAEAQTMSEEEMLAFALEQRDSSLFRSNQ